MTRFLPRRHRRSGALVLTGVALVTALAAFTPASADDDDDGEIELSARLTGANERPGPGDPDGRGKAEIELDGTSVCFELEWRGIDQPNASHIHVGDSTVAGPVVVTLFSGAIPAQIDEVEGCTTAAADLVQRIADNPDGYYVNVHNTAFPAGAIRGQLRD